MAEEIDAAKKVQVPTGLYRHCDGCKALLLTKELDANVQVCPHCGHHHRISRHNTPAPGGMASIIYITAALAL